MYTTTGKTFKNPTRFAPLLYGWATVVGWKVRWTYDVYRQIRSFYLYATGKTIQTINDSWQSTVRLLIEYEITI